MDRAINEAIGGKLDPSWHSSIHAERVRFAIVLDGRADSGECNELGVTHRTYLPRVDDSCQQGNNMLDHCRRETKIPGRMITSPSLTLIQPRIELVPNDHRYLPESRLVQLSSLVFVVLSSENPMANSDCRHRWKRWRIHHRLPHLDQHFLSLFSD